MKNYTIQQDGSILQTETKELTSDEAGALIENHLAAIEGIKKSIAAYTETKNSEMALHQAEIDMLTPAKVVADETLDVLAASVASVAPGP